MSGLTPATREKVNEWITWFNYHSDKVATYPQEKQILWLLKAVNGAFETMSLIAADLNDSKSRSSAGLMLPKTWSFDARR